ncbi:MAG TPA: hypothetical protein VGH22_16325 [Candidatus Binatia bacterium]|jgi:hypothetical protein
MAFAIGRVSPDLWAGGEKETYMTAGELKNFLNSFVEPQHQTFDVRVEQDTGKGPVATYLRKTRVITIYPKKLRSRFELLGTGLHELAHHLTWEVDGHVYASRDGNERHTRHHGKEFLRHLKALVREFNVRYSDSARGMMFCSSRKTTHSLAFVKFSDLERGVNPRFVGLLAADVVFRRPRRFKAKRGHPVFLIGFDGRNQASMYSKSTGKFDYKIPSRIMKLFCRYAAAAPNPGELWEFGLAARRILDASGKKLR